MKSGRLVVIIIGVTILSFLLRLNGLDHGAPSSVHHPDVVKQTVVANAVLHSNRTIHQDLERQYGSRAYQMTMYPYGTATLVGRVMRFAGLETSPSAMTAQEKWSWAYRLRVLAVLFWVLATALMTAWFAIRFGAIPAAIIGLLLAAEPFSNQYSHYGMNTVPMVAMTLVAWLCCLGMGARGWRSWLYSGLAGLTIALGIGIKYQAVFAGLFVLCAWAVLAMERRGRWALFASIAGLVGGFIGLKLTCYIPMHHPAYFAEHIGTFMAWQKTVLGTGIEPGLRIQHNLLWLWRFAWQTGSVVLLPGLVWGLAQSRFRMATTLLQALTFAAAVYVCVMLAALVLGRELMRSNDMLAVLPFLAILSVMACHTWSQSVKWRVLGVGLGGLLALLSCWNVGHSFLDSQALARLDSRDVAAQWCRDHLKPGESVMRERYVNGIGLEGLAESKTRYLCDRRVRDRVAALEFTYLISSSLAYGRFFDPLDPRHQPKNISFYEGLTEHYEVLKVVSDRDLEFSHPVITIYRRREVGDKDE